MNADEIAGLLRKSDSYCTECESVTVLTDGRCSCGSGRVLSIRSLVDAWASGENARLQAAAKGLADAAKAAARIIHNRQPDKLADAEHLLRAAIADYDEITETQP